ncbi:CarD family transcriptional regulator [Thalassiella azotivora]
MNRRTPAPRRELAASPFAAQRRAAAASAQRFEVDDRVTHDRHGMGRVVSVDEECCVVAFRSDTRRIVLPTSRLHKL